jgi:hypothetical protein
MISDVTKTDLNTVTMPSECRTWIITVDPQVEIFGHDIQVDLDWWNAALSERDLVGGPVTCMTEDGSVTDTGTWPLTRGQVFTHASGATEDPEAALGLLWHSMAWGTGSRRRKVLKRMDAIAHDHERTTLALVEAAGMSADRPVDAYERLAPNRKTVIKEFGPAFFTKYLYFAGGGNPGHPCLILDARVAQKLIDIGWTSMHADGGWPSATYGRYLNEIVKPWHASLPANEDGQRPRADLIERWLFGR